MESSHDERKAVRLLKKLLLILSLISAASRLAAEGEQAYPVSWDMVDGAGGYRIELQNSLGDTLLSKVVAKDVLTIYLPPSTGELSLPRDDAQRRDA